MKLRALINRLAGGVHFRPCRRHHQGFTLIELLCVMGIIGILMSLMLPAIFGAYNKVRWQAAEFEAPTIADYLVTGARRYCAEHPNYRFESKADFTEKCVMNVKVRDWMRARSTQFTPFNFFDPTTNTVVVSVTVAIGRKKFLYYDFTKGDLAITPQPQ